MTTIVEADQLSKWYGEVVALNGVDLSIPGGLTGLLGPNGAGKTTLLHLITGQLRTSRGTLRVLGQDPWNNVGLKRRIGFVPETTALWDWMRGHDHVTLAARLYGLDRTEADRRARDRLALVGLDDAAHRRVGGYSRGMRQRLKLAMALVHDPELLVLDEPFTGLDPVGRRQMMALLRQLGDGGTHVLFSSHVLHEVETLTRTIVVLVQGHVVAVGDVHEIRSLMDRHPHLVRVQVDRPRELAQHVVGLPGVVRVQLNDAEQVLEAQTRDPERFYGDLQRLLLDHDHQVTSLTSPDDNLQAVFRYLTREGEA